MNVRDTMQWFADRGLYDGLCAIIDERSGRAPTSTTSRPESRESIGGAQDGAGVKRWGIRMTPLRRPEQGVETDLAQLKAAQWLSRDPYWSASQGESGRPMLFDSEADAFRAVLGYAERNSTWTFTAAQYQDALDQAPPAPRAATWPDADRAELMATIETIGTIASQHCVTTYNMARAIAQWSLAQLARVRTENAVLLLDRERAHRDAIARVTRESDDRQQLLLHLRQYLGGDGSRWKTNEQAIDEIDRARKETPA